MPVTRLQTATSTSDTAGVARMSKLDRFLPVWILFAMGLGLGLGRLIPELDDVLAKVAIGGISLPIAVGLLVMMYPVLAKVRYDKLDTVTGDRKLMISSLVMNWLVGPAVMFALAWTFLADLPEYRTGLIIVGLARCIAMVIIWNDLACGDREAAAVLVALNSIFQVLAFGLLGWFYLDILPGWLGLGDGEDLQISPWKIAVNVIIFLGVPLLAGFLTRRLGEKKLGRSRYEGEFLPRLGPWALYGLLFTIVILFALQGKTITSEPGDVVRIALPLLVYFAIMWSGAFAVGRVIGLPYDRTATLAFTAAGSNFELAIALAIATFGVTSGQALSGVVGPLIEVPVLVALVYVSLALRSRVDGAKSQRWRFPNELPRLPRFVHPSAGDWCLPPMRRRRLRRTRCRPVEAAELSSCRGSRCRHRPAGAARALLGMRAGAPRTREMLSTNRGHTPAVLVAIRLVAEPEFTEYLLRA